MKKLLVLLAIFALSFSLTGCKGEEAENTSFKIASHEGTEYKVECLDITKFDTNKVYVLVKDNKLIGFEIEYDTTKYSYKENRVMLGSFNVNFTKEDNKFLLTTPTNLTIDGDNNEKISNNKRIRLYPVLTYLNEDGTEKTETLAGELSVKMEDLVDFLGLLK
ncbi:hypothetical protein J6Y73_01885 [bacterium]|nr:hypothetical protein [bacterium]